MLIVQRKLGQSIQIGEDIELTVVKISENSIKLGINAPKDIRVKRSEDDSENENKNREENEK